MAAALPAAADDVVMKRAVTPAKDEAVALAGSGTKPTIGPASATAAAAKVLELPAPTTKPLYKYEDRLVIPAAVQAEKDEYDDLAVAERSTAATTVTNGIGHSERTIKEARRLIVQRAWHDWSLEQRETRNRYAGKTEFFL